MKVFLDDIRNPSDCLGYMYKRIGRWNLLYADSWKVVRNYDEFVKTVVDNAGIITHISFDHDLADGHYHESMDNKEAYDKHLATIKEKTGCDCAKFVRWHYTNVNLPLPVMFVHSLNPVGCDNIINVFK